MKIRDGFPVTEYHTLVIPKRHIASYFDLGQAEINAVNQLLQEAKDAILDVDKTVRGFNIGINSGESAGQTIFHCHIHLIPRRDGDKLIYCGMSGRSIEKAKAEGKKKYGIVTRLDSHASID